MRPLLIGSACLLACGAMLAQRASNQDAQLRKANTVMNEIMQTPDHGIPSNLLNEAVCVGIIPSEIKVALGFGGNYGRGVLVCRRQGNGAWGAPSLFTVGGGSFGFQIGGKATDVVFIVMNPKGARDLLQSKVKLGAGASVAAGPVGRSAGASTSGELQAEILSYSRSQGLFAGVSLSGAVITQDSADNKKLYGRKVNPEDVLIRGTVATPAAARPLDRTLTKYSPAGGELFARN